jgi:ABC-type polysaccharide/polyol phosphate transport system ATPase subunit
MSATIKLSSLDLSYPIYSMRAQSLRNTLANIAVGGSLLKDGQDVIHVKALSNINFELHDGDRLGLIGHNGAGKSTLLKVLAGVYEPDKGHIEVKGRISSMIDISLGLDIDLTGRENIITMGRMRGFNIKEILKKIPDIIEFSDLGQFIELPIKTYSAGMTTRLVFAVATSLEPDILLMDEWIGAGDAAFFEKAVSRMNNILEKSRVMVLASHNFTLIKEVCNKLLVLNGGKQVYFGDLKAWDFEHQQPREHNADLADAPKR